MKAQKVSILNVTILLACLATTATARPGRAILQNLALAPAPVPDAAATAPLVVAPTTMNGTTDSSLVTCRGEPVCLSHVCNPDAYKYNITTPNSKFPFTVTYTTTSSVSDTTFVFVVCSNAVATGACGANSTLPGCTPLTNFNLRIRDDIIGNGTNVLATPNGMNWASCKPQGPGYVWDSTGLGNLTLTSPGVEDQCQSVSLMVASDTHTKPSLADICQQNVTIVDNKGNTVFDASTVGAPSCLFTMQNAAGLTAYGALVGPSSAAPAPLDSRQGGLTPMPSPYGNMASSTGMRRRNLRASSSSGDRPAGRMF